MIKTKKQLKRIIIIMASVLIILISAIITTFILLDNFEGIIVLSAIIMLLGLVIILLLKKKYEGLIISYKYQALYETLEPAINVPTRIMTQAWLDSLTKEKFSSFSNFGGFQLFYRIQLGINQKKSNRTLVIMVVIKDEMLPFESQQIVKAINKLEDHLVKKASYSQRIIYQIKSGDAFNQEKVKSTNLVLFLNKKSRNIILINAYHFKTENIVYFVHSKTNPPSPYYDYASNLLIKLLKKEIS